MSIYGHVENHVPASDCEAGIDQMRDLATGIVSDLAHPTIWPVLEKIVNSSFVNEDVSKGKAKTWSEVHYAAKKMVQDQRFAEVMMRSCLLAASLVQINAMREKMEGAKRDN